jgi:hypothetical protein
MIYGALKDKYVPDVLHRPIGAAKLLDLVDNKEFTPDVRNQGGMAACVGFSIGAQLAAKAKKAGTYSEWFSPKWIWAWARYKQGWLAVNCGCYPRDAFDALKEFGGLLEHYWPIDPVFFDASVPPSDMKPEAAKYPIIDRYRVTGNQDDICSAIQTHGFVSIGTPWFPQWETALDGKLQTPQKGWYLPKDNWHETLLYGYDRPRGMFLGMNSWGHLWGKFGYFEMPFEAFEVFSAFRGWDCMYATVPAWPVEPKPPCWLTSLFK